MFEVWTRDYPEETKRVYANSDKPTCERWIQLHTLVHKEGYVIIETHEDSNQLCKDNILVKGYCYSNGWDIDHAGKNRFDYANKWSEYREIEIDQVAATDKEPKMLKYSVPKLNRFSINSIHVNSCPIRVTDPTLAKDGEVLKRTNWYTYGEGEKDWLIPEAWLDEIYLVKKGQIWEAEKNIIDNVIKWKKSPTLPIEEIVKQVRDNPCRSVLIVYIPDDFDEYQVFLNMSYMYSAEFSINEEDLAVTVDLNFVCYKIDQGINGLKVKIYFDTDSYRFKVGTTSRVNIERALQREFPFNRDPDGIYNATIPDIVFEKLEKIIKGFVVKKYGKDVCSDFKIDNLMSALAVCYFPTEPRLFYICTKMHNLGCANEDVLRDINLNPFSIVKNDLNIFKETFGGVPTSIKRLYLEDPYTIVAYYILTHYFGVKDVGLIRDVIDYFPNRR